MNHYKRVVQNGETVAYIIGNALITNTGGGGVQPNHKQACILANMIFDNAQLVNAEHHEIQNRLFRTV